LPAARRTVARRRAEPVRRWPACLRGGPGSPAPSPRAHAAIRPSEPPPASRQPWRSQPRPTQGGHPRSPGPARGPCATAGAPQRDL